MNSRNSDSFRRRHAFTLFELLLVVSLLSITGLAIYNAISNGLRVWEYSQRFSAEEDVAIFFERLTEDLRNTYSYSLIPFDGKPDKLVIPTVIRAPIDTGKKKDRGNTDMAEQMGAAQYFLQSGKKTIFRRQGVYGQALKQKFSEGRALAAPVARLQFSYIFYDKGKQKIEKTSKGKIPASVMVDVEFVEVTGQPRRIKRIIHIPIGS